MKLIVIVIHLPMVYNGGVYTSHSNALANGLMAACTLQCDVAIFECYFAMNDVLLQPIALTKIESNSDLSQTPADWCIYKHKVTRRLLSNTHIQEGQKRCVKKRDWANRVDLY